MLSVSFFGGSMLIALDYDGTFTEDPTLWVSFIAMAQAHGHDVIGVTMRYEFEKNTMLKSYASLLDRVIFTGRLAKKPFLEAEGIKVDIWIDDRPDFILNSASPL